MVSFDHTIQFWTDLSLHSPIRQWLRCSKRWSLSCNVATSLEWFGLPTCCRAAASIIGQNVGDFQLMFLWGTVSCFEGVCGLCWMFLCQPVMWSDHLTVGIFVVVYSSSDPINPNLPFSPIMYLNSLPAFSFSCRFISAMMAFLGQEAAATLDRDGSWTSLPQSLTTLNCWDTWWGRKARIVWWDHQLYIYKRKFPHLLLLATLTLNNKLQHKSCELIDLKLIPHLLEPPPHPHLYQLPHLLDWARSTASAHYNLVSWLLGITKLGGNSPTDW